MISLPSLQRAFQSTRQCADAKHLWRGGAPQAFAPDRLDHTPFIIHALDRVGNWQREQDRPLASIPSTGGRISLSISVMTHARPHGVMHQHPVFGLGMLAQGLEAVQHGMRAGLAAGIFAEKFGRFASMGISACQ